MAGTPPRILGWRLLLGGAIAGFVLAIASVPAAAFVAQQWFGFFGDLIPTPVGYRSAANEGHVVMRYRSPGMHAWVWHRVDPAETRWPIPDEIGRDPSPWWAAGFDAREEPQVQTMAAGWPLLAARHVTAYDDASTGPGQTRGEYNTRILGRSRLIPTEPVWLGLAGNTIFYAGATIALVVLVRVLRRARRRRGNRCVGCGYDLSGGGSVCPECGCAVVAAGNGEG